MWRVCVLMSLCVCVCVNGQCPQGWTGSTKCLRVLSKQNGVCAAAKACEDLGGRLAVEAAVTAVTSTDVFVGLSDLLYEREDLRTGWLWSDGTYANLNIIWAPGEPRESGGDCVKSSNGKLYTENCQQDLPALCELYALRHDIFKPSNFENGGKLRWNEITQTACFEKTTFASIGECINECHVRNSCRALYYDKKNFRCLLSMYFHASLDDGENGNDDDVVFLIKNMS